MRKTEKGFSLIELMVVLGIVAILAAFAWPAYTDNVKTSRQSEMQGSLSGFAVTMEEWKSQNFSYNGATLGALAPTLNADKNYNVSLQITNNNQSYVLRANPKGGNMMAGTGAFALDSQGRTCFNAASDSSCDLDNDSLRWGRH